MGIEIPTAFTVKIATSLVWWRIPFSCVCHVVF